MCIITRDTSARQPCGSFGRNTPEALPPLILTVRYDIMFYILIIKQRYILHLTSGFSLKKNERRQHFNKIRQNKIIDNFRLIWREYTWTLTSSRRQVEFTHLVVRRIYSIETQSWSGNTYIFTSEVHTGFRHWYPVPTACKNVPGAELYRGRVSGRRDRL